MIVKKKPILQGFPAFETVKYLTEKRFFTSAFSPAFYDIETTGLSQNSTFVYLIGSIVREENSWVLYQWMCEDQQEEAELLRTFSQFLSSYTGTITYNGNHFDQPYLEARLKNHGLPTHFLTKPSLDLYQELKPVKNLLKLQKMKQPFLEEFLGIQKRTNCSGKECIQLYHTYEKQKGADLIQTIMGHNEEDLGGLLQIVKMLGYLTLYEENYQIQNCMRQEDQLIFTLRLPIELPVEFSNGLNEFYMTGYQSVLKLSVKLKEGRLKQYYANYKDYDYLPAEDMAVPKSLSQYMDKKLRAPAKMDTCYTWFSCTDDFMNRLPVQQDYLRHAFQFLSKAFK